MLSISGRDKRFAPYLYLRVLRACLYSNRLSLILRCLRRGMAGAARRAWARGEPAKRVAKRHLLLRAAALLHTFIWARVTCWDGRGLDMVSSFLSSTDIQTSSASRYSPFSWDSFSLYRRNMTGVWDAHIQAGRGGGGKDWRYQHKFPAQGPRAPFNAST